MRTKLIHVLHIVCCIVGTHAVAQHATMLPRSLPELEGVSSDSIIHFLDAVGRSKNELHSFMFVRHGKVIAEGWWHPYEQNLKHTMYSVSKSFTSTAIGLAVDEKRLSLTDKVISFFPHDLPDSVDANLSALTVDDLLTMTAGQDPDPSPKILFSTDHWLKSFLSTPLPRKPGTYFVYNTVASYVLSAILQKVTGPKTIDYLQSRLFIPMGIMGIDWETSPDGESTGGWGLRLKTEDMAKFGQLYLNKGQWNGKQLLSAKWVSEATSDKIKQPADFDPDRQVDSSDVLQGYGYQFWRCRHNAFRADGAFGQFIIVMPDQDAVIAITSESMDTQDELNLVWKYLLPAMQTGALPVDKALTKCLKNKLASLALPVPQKNRVTIRPPTISGKTFIMEANQQKIKALNFYIKDAILQLSITMDGITYKHRYASGNWQADTTTRHGPYFLQKAKGSLTGLPPFKTAGTYHWVDGHNVELILRYVESSHTETITCTFKENEISVEFKTSIVFEKKKPVLNGHLVE